MARSSMAALILRVRDLIGDTLPLGSGQVWTDDQIQDVLDESREDLANKPLDPKPTYSGSTIQYLNYYSDYGGWESDYVLKQYLTVAVTPSAVEEIAGHFSFASNVFPPVMITGKRFDIYRAAADLLERWSAKVVRDYDVIVGGQTFRRSQSSDALLKLARHYRAKQRIRSVRTIRTDLVGNASTPHLGPTALDYMASGNGGG